MKIAVVISGEYRTFDYCRKTMSFLDLDMVDIYFSTWDTSVYRIPTTKIREVHPVTEERIRAALGKSATIEIQASDLITERRYNSKMIWRWVRGIKMVKDSGISYDYILLLRPDIFFRHAHLSQSVAEQLAGKMGVGWWTPSGPPGKLADNVMLAAADIMFDVIQPDMLDQWVSAPETDWHTWWNSYVLERVNVTGLPSLNEYMFCRNTVVDSDQYEQVFSKYENWRDLTIIDQLRTMPESHMRRHWPQSVIDRARRRYLSRKLFKDIKLW